MAQNSRRPSVVSPIILISIGVLFLIGQFRPSFHPWIVLWTYWPLFLILIGAGLMYDSWRHRQNPDAPRGAGLGLCVGAVIFFIVLFALAARGERYGRWNRGSFAMQHLSRSVDRQNAKTVHADVEMNAGNLNLSGGSSHLLEADFDYRSSSSTPRVDYSVSGTTGDLRISQDDSDSGIHTNFHTTSDNRWTLHFANDVPLDLKIEMGAGRGNLRFRDIDVTHFSLDIGAGQVDVDLTGDRKSDLNASIEGGVGEADIRLPKNIGVIVNASGGIGTIDAPGLHHDGDEYTNDAYGKSPVTIHLRVEGGVGRIGLRLEP
ncbi:MAG TPA: toast rack family protein [Candidatus Methylomirabilis sp.]|nr:toast rack family protein [Candidatus Methylomirabilis sp.]